MQIAYTIYAPDDEIIDGGVCHITAVPVLTTDHLIAGNTIVLEPLDDE